MCLRLSGSFQQFAGNDTAVRNSMHIMHVPGGDRTEEKYPQIDPPLEDLDDYEARQASDETVDLLVRQGMRSVSIH
ncbi:MAG: hypothetical protein WD049_03980 [Candidatus Paceibacterota bacterium]